MPVRGIPRRVPQKVSSPHVEHVAPHVAPHVEPKAIGAGPGHRPTLPVTGNDEPRDRAFASVGIHPAGHKSPALDLEAILAAPEDRRDTLLWRFIGNAALRAGLALGASQTRLPASLTVTRPGLRMSTDDGRVVVVTLDGETRAIDTVAAHAGDAAFALRALDRALVRDGEVDAGAAAFFLPLFGPDGAFVRGRARGLPDDALFARPKLVCWDFNGTVERFDDGRTRADLPGSTACLRRRGGVCVLTTTMRPEKPELFLESHGVSFVAHYGDKQVRPTSGNKAYAGVARAHGVDPAEARHVMAVFGDSRTDAPQDLPGVLFFHNDAATPAPAVELLLAELDRRGRGSLADGLVALLDGLPATGENKRASVGPVSFVVELRDTGTPDAPCLVPTVHEVAVHHTVDELVRVLRKMPPPSKLDARALYRLALEDLADGFPLADVPAVLRGVAGHRGARAVRAAVNRRLAWHDEATARAREELLDKTPPWVRKPTAVDDLLRRLRALVELGDPALASRAQAVARELVDDASAAERDMLASIAAHARSLRAHVKKAQKAALPLAPGAPPPDPRIPLLEAVARDPVPYDPERQAQQIEAIDAILTSGPLVGSAPLLKRILERLDEKLPKERKTLRKRFAARRDRADEILAAAAGADDVAARTPTALEAVREALER